ncbi:hypothetical protein [Pseudoalteromonas sp. NBT06-2]|uniref:hypothetical protein n=1 Tax=Pseudoalteromonas sp. NBT06-2 TaxID=2025950 RepID=UPI0020756ACE|nr:hypothetical protein [Pseudoalteromonas sp. NBT06-2]
MQSQFAGNIYFGDENQLPSNMSVLNDENSNTDDFKKELEHAGFKSVVVKIEMTDLYRAT